MHGRLRFVLSDGEQRLLARSVLEHFDRLHQLIVVTQVFTLRGRITKSERGDRAPNELVELMTKVLEEDGRFEVRVAATGFDAGMMVKEYRPDLLVLDVMLPDINGREVCQRVRSDKTMDDVKIICISGMIENDKIEDLKAAGANDFMHKPFEVETLIDRIGSLLDVESVATG